MTEVIQPPPRIGFDWPRLDIHTLDMEFIDADPMLDDLEPFERIRQEEEKHGRL